ncbi:MAG: hypothetical protein IKV16_03405 [Clostridia bacterium]|nr:hypothetical protein [Clostridia bacterium]
MKRIISLILLLVLTVTAFTACDRKYDENEVKAAAEKLIAESILLNDIFWGDGLPHYEDKNYSDGDYYAAIEAYHYGLGFTTVSELRALTESVFSTEYTNIIASTVFSEIYDGQEMVYTSRYYQKYSAGDGVTPESIMVNSNWKKLLNGEVSYDYSSLTVTHSEDEVVYVTINATVTLDGKNPKTSTLEIGLIEEDAGWRIHTPTYLNYN